MVNDDNAPINTYNRQNVNKRPIYYAEKSQQKGYYSILYRVTWIENLQMGIIVTTQLTSDIIVKEFLQMVIQEFNQTFNKAEIELFFFFNDFNIYELYEMNEYERSDEELSPYDEHQKLCQLKTKSFCFETNLNNVEFFNGVLFKQSPFFQVTNISNK
ncbi:unnamed protein product [Paramecium primaurelia]|uniref:Uncharacterized protein n=1 Tax=Paramecium primaurelia TaxID=5886 RepID=A0A8S1P0E0_PARPR|nr:unnamed protein product [Paramecium primaurelia]